MHGLAASSKTSQQGADEAPRVLYKRVAEILERLLRPEGHLEREGIRAISASRRVVVALLLQYDSCPSHHEVGGFFFDFEAIRTVMLRAGAITEIAHESSDRLPGVLSRV